MLEQELLFKNSLSVGAIEGQLLVLVGTPVEGEGVVGQVDPALLNVKKHQPYLVKNH